jgi:hypothetical protein
VVRLRRSRDVAAIGKLLHGLQARLTSVRGKK